jgi:hypothetical protein
MRADAFLEIRPAKAAAAGPHPGAFALLRFVEYHSVAPRDASCDASGLFLCSARCGSSRPSRRTSKTMSKVCASAALGYEHAEVASPIALQNNRLDVDQRLVCVRRRTEPPAAENARVREGGAKLNLRGRRHRRRLAVPTRAEGEAL